MFIFVHGLYGWGEADELWSVLPYWGLASGCLTEYLAKKGCACAAASVSPTGSARDRACELYACLTGSVTDYGAAHAAKHGHPRFGRAYSAPLFPAWSTDTPADFICHSFGGATARMLAHLLEYGCPEESAACADPSPLFRGGQGKLVRSITCIAAPHNGTTLLAAQPELPQFAASLAGAAAKAASSLPLAEGLRERVRFPAGGEDTAFADLGLAGARRLNLEIKDVPTVYYLSVPCCRTHGGLSLAEKPDLTMPPLLRASAAVMGSYYNKSAEQGYVSAAWAKNDGLVNTVSAQAPEGALRAAVPYPGRWCILPVRNDDHFEIIGGFSHADIPRVHSFYTSLLKQISGIRAV